MPSADKQDDARRNTPTVQEAAELYYRDRAHGLLEECGFVEHADGSWHPTPEEKSDGSSD